LNNFAVLRLRSSLTLVVPYEIWGIYNLTKTTLTGSNKYKSPTIIYEEFKNKEENQRKMNKKRVLLVTSYVHQIRERLAKEETSPRQDFDELAKALDAELISFSDLETGPTTVKMATKLFNPAIGLAVYGYLKKADFYLTLAENTGMFLALLLKFRRGVKQVIIGHKISAGKKRYIFTALNLFSNIDGVIAYSHTQLNFARDFLKVPDYKLHRIDFQVDQKFYTDDGSSYQSRHGIVSIGRELRDYQTFIEAVRGLDINVTIVASSPWSRRKDETKNRDLPANIELKKGLTSEELRTLYRSCQMVVIPLQNVDSPAGVTSLLEAQSVNRPVIITNTIGIQDSLSNGGQIPATIGDAEDLRTKIKKCIYNPDYASKISQIGHDETLEKRSLDQYISRIKQICEDAENHK
jgi:glycosyltransferase involved in cell wall biosynthesis